MKLSHIRKTMAFFSFCIFCLFVLAASQAFGAASSGYSEYFIPGDEVMLHSVLDEIGGGDQTLPNANMHSIITVTVWSDNTTVYYDHWENGYTFNPDLPVSTADEIFDATTTPSLVNRGDYLTLEGTDIPTAPRGTSTFYDGRDRIYVVGGAATVSRAAWTESAGVLLAVAWEVYPVRPQLTTYILPFGEDLAANNPPDLQDFERVYALIQATEDGTDLQIDLDKDGIWDDLDWNRDGTTIVGDNSYTLNTGDVFLLDQTSINGAASGLNSGTKIQASGTIQVQYIIGDQGSTYEIRGLSAFPRGFWDDEYYAPVNSGSPAFDGNVDIYLYNPHDSILSINYETTSGSGTYTINPKTTRSFYQATSSYVPLNSSVYLKGDDVFWGISTIDVANSGHDWGYSLVPAFLLENEHFMGWAPGSFPVSSDGSGWGAGDPDQDARSDSGVYIAAAQDNIRIFVDRDADGTADFTYDLNRLETQYVYDSVDGDLSGANFWATGNYVMAYGQNPDFSTYYAPAIDVGYTTIPGNDFIDLVLTVDKSVSPQIIPTASGSTADWTLVVNSYDFSIDSISVVDTLPAGWEYVAGNTVITLPDTTQVTGATADDGNSTGDTSLTWSGSDVFGSYASLAANQKITITFTARTTQVFTAGTISKNDVKAVGSRTVEGVTQTFTTTDFVFVSYGDSALTIDKTTSGVDPLSPGDLYTYTVVVTNPVGGADVTGISIYDPLPAGITYVTSSSQVTAPVAPIRSTEYYIAAGTFTGTTYNLTLAQELASDYFVMIRGAASGGVSRGPDDNYAALTADPNGTGDLSATGSTDVISLTRGGTDGDWVGVVTVVECLSDQTGNGFTLLDAQRVAHPAAATSGTDISSTAWTDIGQVLLMGGFYGAGCDTAEANTANITSCFARIYPSGTNTINWTRQTGGATLATATSTVMVLEWGSDWTVQRVNATGTNGGNGAAVAANYNTAAISSVVRDNTWVWGTGHTDDNGLGDGGEGVLVTLGDGETQNASETTVAVATEYSGTAIDYEVYVMTHSGLAVDYQFKIDGDPGLTYDETVDSATADSARMGLVYNGSNGTGAAYPRPIQSARYTSDTNIRLERQYDGQAYPAWTQGIDFSSIPGGTVTQSANNSPNFVASGDGYSLSSGETLTLTFDATVDDPLATGIDEILNTAYVTAAELAVPLSDDATNLVNNPSSATGEVGDLVWMDTNGNGVKDVGENGLSNVQVTLKDQFGTPLGSSTTTDSTGHYSFTGIEPGSGYYVEITGGLPAGLVQSAPSGHSDDRTDAFNLAAGQVYLNADLGYTSAASTGTIGDFVWNDADADGSQDSGELGLAGVTVQLWQDTNGTPGFQFGTGSGDDTLIDTQDTGADGSYLFAGVPATGSEDYFVFVDASQSALTGYSNTTPISTQVDNLADGDARLANDFGFRNLTNPTYTYKDRVWFDADEDQDDDDVTTTDNGETGISGVTVNLLDASRNVLATVTTDANGYFTFSGLSGGTFYYAQISDTSGKLTDYFGTTAEAVAGEIQISNLTADRDDTVEPTEPNFGYSLNGAIGDTVFNDVDGNGTQDAGELGISGVNVALYNDDDGDGVIDAGIDLQLATLSTDANGNYLFSGLADGDYIVSIGTPPSGFSFTGTDSDTSAAGDQLSANITSGNSNLTKDFGYQSADNRSVSGTLWNDSDDEGDFDETVYFENVTVELRDSTGTTLIGTTTTNASGNYSFAGLPSAVYTIFITDDNGILNGYSTTYEKTEGAKAGSYNGEESVDLTSADVSDVDFGYYKPPAVTRAVIGEFGAFTEGGKVVVRWQTVSEFGTVGFYLHRLNEKTGKYKAVNKKLLPGLLHSSAGGSYSYEDKKAKTNTYYSYRLEEVEAGGKRIMYGPWRVYTGTRLSAEDAVIKLDDDGSIAGFRKTEKPLSDKKIARLTEKMESRLSGYAKKLSRTGGKAKIYVAEDGLYFIDAQDMARVFDISLEKITKLIRKNKVRLQSMGLNVAVLPAEDNSGLYFYGERRETRYSDDNVYWLNINKAQKMKSVNRAPKKPAEDLQYFYQWVWEEESNYPMTALFSDPGDDFWMWDFIFPGYIDQVSLSASTPGIMDIGNATISVALKGATDTFVGNDHHAMIRINGVEVGETQWDGLDSTVISMSVAASILNDGENIVEVVGINDPDVAFNYFYINNLQIVYPRSYSSVDNMLTAENNGYSTIRMDGFTDSDIRVFDITNPGRPKVLSKVVIEPSESGSGDFQVRFKAGGILQRYLAVTPDVIKPCTLIADQPSYLKKRINLGDYLIITSTDMVTAAQRLADYRATQGYVSMVVDVEDIYDEFSYGISDAEAIRSFLAYAYSKWRLPPRYVLLAGDGSFDYKDNKGFGDSVIPALLKSIPEDGMRVTDLPYADVLGNDWIPEFALGRIPVISENELLDYINKVIGYESSDGAWTRQAILAADAPDAGGEFISSSEEVAGLFPADFLLDKLYLDVMPLSTARADFVADINEGRAYVNFIGHGAMFQVGNNKLFSTADLSKLNNNGKLPVFTAMTCVAGDFGYPGYDALNEALVLKADGGAIAMWAPSGFSFNPQSVELCKGFYNAVFIGGETVLGDAIRRSQESFAGQGEKLYHLDLYNLLGDPALRLK